jgi:hypothetical protein
MVGFSDQLSIELCKTRLSRIVENQDSVNHRKLDVLKLSPCTLFGHGKADARRLDQDEPEVGISPPFGPLKVIVAKRGVARKLQLKLCTTLNKQLLLSEIVTAITLTVHSLHPFTSSVLLFHTN